MHISELQKNEYNSFYQTYINTLEEVALVPEMVNRSNALTTILEKLSDEDFNFSYASGKWTIKELLLHIIDTERVFQYRAFTFARHSGCSLEGFDQDLYVENSFSSLRSKSSLLEEFKSVRGSSISLFSSFGPEVYNRFGFVEGHKLSVRAAGFILCGHQKHHETVLMEKYLPHLAD
ncbi:DinB family protein [Galbibacter mesophilus]|uniref:DinB family protein n=1 Tax=Galbibacter mesophilus TaxID=379069 RepID=UPI00191EC998|nr:DinB family protein [Galbibacter mesophilus]MCM5664092.1 DinB family protein [Galbibacter mesophilus]